jgi:hypothetical protein
VDGYGLLNLNARYQPFQHVELWARVDNATDAHYATGGALNFNAFGNPIAVERFVAPGAPIGGWSACSRTRRSLSVSERPASPAVVALAPACGPGSLPPGSLWNCRPATFSTALDRAALRWLAVFASAAAADPSWFGAVTRAEAFLLFFIFVTPPPSP